MNIIIKTNYFEYKEDYFEINLSLIKLNLQFIFYIESYNNITHTDYNFLYYKINNIENFMSKITLYEINNQIFKTLRTALRTLEIIYDNNN